MGMSGHRYKLGWLKATEGPMDNLAGLISIFGQSTDVFINLYQWGFASAVGKAVVLNRRCRRLTEKTKA